MIITNKRFVYYLAIFMIFMYGVICILTYKYTMQYAEMQSKKKLDLILLTQKSLHHYFETELKPVIYSLEEQGRLENGFFDRRLMSFTYAADAVHTQLNRYLAEANQSEIHFKLASDHPRNPKNLANEEEKKLIEKFRNNPKMHEFSSIIVEDGEKHIYYAMPVERMEESCMRCHSTPDRAPDELVKKYGPTSGFGEKFGEIPAIITLKIPFGQEIEQTQTIFYIIIVSIGILLLTIYAVFVYFIGRLGRKQSAIEEQNRLLKILSEHDGLTGVYNRRSFQTILEEKINEHNFALMIIDIDYFKQINDIYGHQKGDEVLCTVAHLLEENIRKNDVLCRIGGEEFAILTVQEGAAELAERLINEIDRYDFGIQERVHISIGVSAKYDDETPDTMYKNADEALYRAKESGRNQFVFF